MSDVCSADLTDETVSRELSGIVTELLVRRFIAGADNGEAGARQREQLPFRIKRQVAGIKIEAAELVHRRRHRPVGPFERHRLARDKAGGAARQYYHAPVLVRSEEHTSELQSPMRISYAVFFFKKKNQ